MSKFTKHFSIAMVAVLFLGIFYVLTPRVYAAPDMAIVNPVDGTHDFTFAMADLPVNATFNINLTISGVINLATWQAKVTWDPTLLEFVNFTFPSDHVLSTLSPIKAPTDSSVPGSVLVGAAAGPGAGSFTGSGTLGVLELRNIQGVPVGGDPKTCQIQYANIGPDTFLLDADGNDIKPFTTTNGVYTLNAAAAPGKPSFQLVIDNTNPQKGDTMQVAVKVSGVDAAWEIIGFQFSIMWNSTLIAPTAPVFANGSFLEQFQYNGDGVIYATDINAHNRPPPGHQIADDYNYSTVGEILMADSSANNTYHALFPSGSGTLATLRFVVIRDDNTTTIPSSIEFIPEDILVLTASGTEIGYKTATGATYTIQRSSSFSNAAIDLYTQYHSPFGGQGYNKTSDSFGPQQSVILCANLTYHGFGVPEKLVAFEIRHTNPDTGVLTFHFTREANTNDNGVACIAFTIPWQGNNTGDVFGWWYVTATSDVGGNKTIDNLRFWVWWLVEVTSLEPGFSKVTQQVGNVQRDNMSFTLSARTYHMQGLPTLLTATINDELGFPIGFGASIFTEENAVRAAPYYNSEWTSSPPPTGNYTIGYDIPLVQKAVVGVGTAYGNAFNTWPLEGGVAYCPEKPNTKQFEIVAPIT